jgi:serine/threonine protein kinase
MDRRSEGVCFGRYSLVRELRPGRVGRRWLALHQDRQTTHVLHELPTCPDRERRRGLSVHLESLARLRQSHLLPVERFAFLSPGQMWVVTPYTGNQVGLVSLDDLLSQRGGSLGPAESLRAARHVLEASAAAHAAGLAHGGLHGAEILVDPSGSLVVELYGVSRLLEPGWAGERETIADEVRSIVELCYGLLTGVSADEPRITPSRLVRRLDPRWDAWFERGLDPARGFATAEDALGGLPGSSVPEPEPAVVRVRRMLDRFGRGLVGARGAVDADGTYGAGGRREG